MNTDRYRSGGRGLGCRLWGRPKINRNVGFSFQLSRIFHAFEMFIDKASGAPLYACTASP